MKIPMIPLPVVVGLLAALAAMGVGGMFRCIARLIGSTGTIGGT
jgi:hypothetical protein